MSSKLGRKNEEIKNNRETKKTNANVMNDDALYLKSFAKRDTFTSVQINKTSFSSRSPRSDVNGASSRCILLHSVASQLKHQKGEEKKS
jgi:CRISPR/Cas system CSM-associated protein Csm2 small subunit